MLRPNGFARFARYNDKFAVCISYDSMMSMTTPLWSLPTDHAVLAKHVTLVGTRAVDVGAGAGGLVRFLREQGADPIGVEGGASMMAQALEADPEHREAYVDGVGQDLPLDDATAVRAAAQAALDNDMPATMIERDEVRYTTSYSYVGVAELEKDMADIDPTRQATFDAVKDEVVELFHANAVEHDGAYWFAQPVIMRLFTKG